MSKISPCDMWLVSCSFLMLILGIYLFIIWIFNIRCGTLFVPVQNVTIKGPSVSRIKRTKTNILPCGKVVHIENYELLNYLANVTFTSPNDFEGYWNLTLSTNVPFTFVGGWGISLQTDPSNLKVFITNKDSVELDKDDIIEFRIRISWGRDQKVPKVSSIIWENIHICNLQTKRYQHHHQFVHKTDTDIQSIFTGQEGNK